MSTESYRERAEQLVDEARALLDEVIIMRTDVHEMADEIERLTAALAVETEAKKRAHEMIRWLDR